MSQELLSQPPKLTSGDSPTPSGRQTGTFRAHGRVPGAQKQ